MRILYLYDGEWPKGATRVLKETRTLAYAGHEVVLVVRNAGNAPPRVREPWMTVWRLPRIPLRTIRYALNFPLFINPVWLLTIWRAVRDTRPELILVCDLPLAPCAVWFGRIFRIPVHYDMAEVYPEFLRSLRQLERQSAFRRLVRSPRLAEWVERPVLNSVACTYVVSQESRERAVGLGVHPDRLVIVGNTPEQLPDLSRDVEPPADIVDLVHQDLEILLFVGILIADRGVSDVIRAFPALLARRPNAALVVVGDGPARAALAHEVQTLGLSGRVRLVGWKAQEELVAYYRASRIGLLPFRDSPHVRLTLANKLFDYMGASLPVLGSDLPPIRRVLEETGAGWLHHPDSPTDIARVAADLLDDESTQQVMGARGRSAAESIYSWKDDAARLRAAVMQRR